MGKYNSIEQQDFRKQIRSDSPFRADLREITIRNPLKMFISVIYKNHLKAPKTTFSKRSRVSGIPEPS